MKIVMLIALISLLPPSVCHAQRGAIDLPVLIAEFLVPLGKQPDWNMGAGPATPQIIWATSGIEERPYCGGYESCRRGVVRVRLDGKELMHLRQRLEPVSWEIEMLSESSPRFGPTRVHLTPRCDTVDCYFDFKKAIGNASLSLRQLCRAGPAPFRQTAYVMRKGTRQTVLVVEEGQGSGGANASIVLLYKPAEKIDFCAEARGVE